MNLQLRPGKAPFGITIFLSAFLLFWVQLLLGKYILLWFGGAGAVWTTCMLFFQMLLLGGYAYAHLLSSRLESRAQGLLHCAVVLSSLLLLGCLAVAWNSPITPGSKWKPHGADHPVIQIVALLSVSVGLPYFVSHPRGRFFKCGTGEFMRAVLPIGCMPFRTWVPPSHCWHSRRYWNPG